jgi:hypothetical protein
MKPAPKYNTAKFSTNQRIGYWNELEIERRQKALEALEIAKAQNKPVKYDIKR